MHKLIFTSSCPVQKELTHEVLLREFKECLMEEKLFKTLPEAIGGYMKYGDNRNEACFITLDDIAGCRLIRQDGVKEHFYLAGGALYTRVYSENDRPENFSSPAFLKRIALKYGGRDDSLMATPEIRNWDEMFMDELAGLLRKKRQFSMPVLYITKQQWNNIPFIDVDHIAERLAGCVHIVLESDKGLSLKVKAETGVQLPYGGNALVSFPNGFYLWYSRQYYQMQGAFEDAICSSIMNNMCMYLNNPVFSWTSLENRSLKSRNSVLRNELKNVKDMLKNHVEFGERFEMLKEYAERLEEINEGCIAELQEVQQQKDADMAKAEERIAKLEQELEKKNRILEGYSHKKGMADDNTSIMLSCKEKDLYQGEIKDCVLSVLSNALSQMTGHKDKRRSQYILESIIEANTPDGTGVELRNRLKDMFYTADRDLSSQDKRDLIAAGFTYRDEGKHIVIKYNDDDRFSFTVAKTSSDTRALRNAFTSIDQRLFG